MNPQGSDDDDQDGSLDQDLTDTGVLLGYASRESDGENTISRLGGRPDWLDPGRPASAALARCGACNRHMTLLLQLNGELPDRFPGHERRLYVFACRRPGCRRREGSVRAVRGVRVFADENGKEEGGKEEEGREGGAGGAEEEQQQKTGGKDGDDAERERAPGLGEQLFGGGRPGSVGTWLAGAGVNPFAAPGAPTTSPKTAAAAAAAAVAALPQALATALTLDSSPRETTTKKATPSTTASAAAAAAAKTPSPPESWPAESDLPKPYPVLYLSDADYETLDSTPAATPALPPRSRVQDEGDHLDKDMFESSMDSTFQRFADRLGQNPEQVIRYEFGGRPLPYSRDDRVGKILEAGAGGAPRCKNCGAARAFEVQLTPHAITELEADEDGLDGMEWGTIVVAVCERDCEPAGGERGSAGYVEEWAGVQWEEELGSKVGRK